MECGAARVRACVHAARARAARADAVPTAGARLRGRPERDVARLRYDGGREPRRARRLRRAAATEEEEEDAPAVIWRLSRVGSARPVESGVGKSRGACNWPLFVIF